MALYSPAPFEFNFIYSNVSATRLVQGWGQLHTAAVAPNFSTYATLVTAANITTDIYGIELTFSNGFANNTIRNMLVNIGIDTAGGTAFTTRIPQLIVGHAGALNLVGGIHYYFPLYIPSGSSIGIQATANVAFSVNTAIKLYGRPSNPDSVNAGSYVINYGTVIGTGATGATGTPITLGAAAEGAYTLVGTTTRNHWWWQMGYTASTTGATAGSIGFDLAAGSSITLNKQIFQDMLFFIDGTERIWNVPTSYFAQNGITNTGDNIYIRGQGSAAANIGSAVAAYGLGG